MADCPRWLDDAEQCAWRSFLRMQTHLFARLARRLSIDSDLSMPDYAVLVNLTDLPDGRMRVLELARAMEWEKSRLSHHLDRMIKRGLVSRAECPSDGRGALVVVTPAGREAIEAAAPLHVQAVRQLFFDFLTADHVTMLAEVSERVLAGLDENAADPRPR
jgi:DNA-binding MarR family transcriptional regulator